MAKNVVKVTFGLAISNNGDGSASPRLFKTIEEAEAWDEKQMEGGDHFAESTARELELSFKDGELVGFGKDGCREY